MRSVYLLWCRAYSSAILLGVFSSESAAVDWLRKQNGSMTYSEKKMCDIELWLVDEGLEGCTR